MDFDRCEFSGKRHKIVAEIVLISIDNRIIDTNKSICFFYSFEDKYLVNVYPY